MMKIFVLGLLLIGLTLTQSTAVTKKVEKRNVAQSSKIEVTSKLEKSKDLTSKDDDSRGESAKVVSLKIEPVKLESSKVESLNVNNEKSNEDEKHDLKLEDDSDQTQVDREKKSCKTLTSQPSAPAKFCMEISGSPSTVTICDDDKPSYDPGPPPRPHPQPQPLPLPLPQPQPSYDHHPIYDWHYPQPQPIPLDIQIEHVPQQTNIPTYINVQPQPSTEYVPVYPVAPQIPYHHHHGLDTKKKIHPFFHHHHFSHTHHHGDASGPVPTIYLVPGTQSYPQVYPSGGHIQPVIPTYAINNYPATTSYPIIKPVVYPGGYYPGGSYPNYHLGPHGYYTSCTCKQTLSPSQGNVIVQPGSSPTYGSHVIVGNPRSVDPSNEFDQGLSQSSSDDLQSSFGGLRASANLGGLGASANLRGLRESPGNFGDSGNSPLRISTNLRAPGLDNSSSLGFRTGQEPNNQGVRSQRFPQANNDPAPSMDVWGPVTNQGQRFSRGPDESSQEDRPNESQNYSQTQTSQMTTLKKSSPKVHQVAEKINMDDENVRKFQNQSPEMQQFIIERARQHLHENSPAVNARYEDMDRISI